MSYSLRKDLTILCIYFLSQDFYKERKESEQGIIYYM